MTLAPSFDGTGFLRQSGRVSNLIVRGPLPWADVRAYGAKADGTTDDGPAIQRAVNSGAKIVFAPAGTYAVTTGVTVPSNVWIQGAGPATVFRGVSTVDDAKIFTATGTYSTTSALGVNAAEGAKAITLTAGGVVALGIAAGSLVKISQTANGWPYAQLFRVRSVTGNTVNLYEPLADAYTTANGAVVRNLTAPTSSFTLSDCTLDGNALTGTNGHGLWLVGASYTVVRDVLFTGFNGVGMLLWEVYAPKLSNITAEDSGSAGYSDIYLEYCTNLAANNITSQRSSGFGPGLNNVVHSQLTNISAYGAINRSIKLAASAYNVWSNVVCEGGTETGFSVTIASHHNVVSGLVSLGHSGSSAGLWIGDGFSGASLLPSHHNRVNGYVGRFDATQDLLLDADSQDNIVDLAVSGVVVNTGARNVVRPPTHTQEGRSAGVNTQTTSSTNYSTLTGDGASSELAVSITTTGGSLECLLVGTFFHNTVGGATFVALSLDAASEVGAQVVHCAVINTDMVVTVRWTFTGVSAGTHVVRGRWKIDNGAHQASAQGALRGLWVKEGLVV